MKKIAAVATLFAVLFILAACQAIPYADPAVPQTAGDAQSPVEFLQRLSGKDGVSIRLTMAATANLATLRTDVHFYQEDGNVATRTALFGGEQRSVISGGKLYVMLDDKKAMSVLNVAAAGSLPINRQILPTLEDIDTFGEPQRVDLGGRECLLYTGRQQNLPIYYYADAKSYQPVRFIAEYGGASLTIDYIEFMFGDVERSVFEIPQDYKSIKYSDLVSGAG